jgi:hypothetical protein
MSTFIKLLITALVLNACFQGGRSAWGFYQFEDAVQQAVLFSSNQSEAQLQTRILGIASEQAVTLEPESLSVTYRGTQARITASYVDDVRVLPGGAPYKWRHELDVDLRRMPF